MRIPPPAKHMHPVHDENRRKGRVATLSRKLRDRQDVRYTDAV